MTEDDKAYAIELFADICQELENRFRKELLTDWDMKNIQPVHQEQMMLVADPCIRLFAHTAAIYVAEAILDIANK